MRISNSMMSSHVRTWLLRAQERMFMSQSQAASGLRLQHPSDDPTGAAQASLLRADSARHSQYLEDIQSAKFWLKVTEAKLADLTEQVRNLRDLAVGGAGQMQETAQRTALVSQVRAIQDQLADLANVQINGRFIFAGQATKTEPMDLSGGLPPTYAGSTSPSQISISPQTALTVGVTADRLYNIGGSVSGGYEDLISTCADLGDQIEAGDAQAVSQLIDDFEFHLSNVLAIRGEIGAKLQTCEAAADRLAALQETTTVSLSELKDADLSQVLMELAEHQNAYQAAAGIAASLNSISLLDFLR